MQKQKKVLANLKGETVSQSLGLKSKERVEFLMDRTKKIYLEEKSISKAIGVCHKEAKSQEEFLFMLYLIGLQKGEIIGEGHAAKVMASDMAQSLFRGLGTGKNDAFFGCLDAFTFFLLIFTLINLFFTFPVNWWMLPIVLFVFVLIVWRRLK